MAQGKTSGCVPVVTPVRVLRITRPLTAVLTPAILLPLHVSPCAPRFTRSHYLRDFVYPPCQRTGGQRFEMKGLSSGPTYLRRSKFNSTMSQLRQTGRIWGICFYIKAVEFIFFYTPQTGAFAGTPENIPHKQGRLWGPPRIYPANRGVYGGPDIYPANRGVCGGPENIPHKWGRFAGGAPINPMKQGRFTGTPNETPQARMLAGIIYIT